jgi:hypothetical protein
MTFSLADIALFTALVATTASVLLVYRRLRTMGRMLAEYQAASESSARALENAVRAVGNLNAETRTLVAVLDSRPSESNGPLEDSARERRRLQLVHTSPEANPFLHQS